MDFDRTTTLGIFAGLIVIGAGGLLASGVMTVGTVLVMVLPAMIVFGLVCLAIGVRYGEYRTTGRT
jgi:hypothetical protein